MILRRIFERSKSGFYVDVGAHHPFRFSNTFYFYKLGWRGINIDAMPGSSESFNKLRPRDINIETGVGNGDSFLTYYVFNEPALNGFSEELSSERDGDKGFFVVDKIKVRVRELRKILDEYLPKGTSIDFMSIDVEGFDLDVLRSNDWEKYSPKAILVEVIFDDLAELYQNEIVVFLVQHGYKVYAKAINTVIFIQHDDSFRFS